jgi:hypothetical protein
MKMVDDYEKSLVSLSVPANATISTPQDISVIPPSDQEKPKRHLRGWKRRKDERPVEIVAAVKAAIAERGIDNVRMEDIALRANVVKGTLYLYFSSKAELLELVRSETYPPQEEASNGCLSEE